MDDKHMKSYTTSSARGKCKLKPHWDNTAHPLEITKKNFKKQYWILGENVEQLDFHTLLVERSGDMATMGNCSAISTKNEHISTALAIPFLSMNTREKHMSTKKLRMFKATLLITAWNWKLPKCLLTTERIVRNTVYLHNGILFINENEHTLSTCNNLEWYYKHDSEGKKKTVTKHINMIPFKFRNRKKRIYCVKNQDNDYLGVVIWGND